MTEDNPQPTPDRQAALPRYGIEWQGKDKPICVPMADGYRTPWRIANAALTAPMYYDLNEAIKAWNKARKDNP